MGGAQRLRRGGRQPGLRLRSAWQPRGRGLRGAPGRSWHGAGRRDDAIGSRARRGGAGQARAVVRRAFSGVLVGECVAVCPHCRAGPSRAGRPEELASVPSASPATRAVVTGAEGARVGGGAAAPLVRGSDSGRAAGVVLSRTTGQASSSG